MGPEGKGHVSDQDFFFDEEEQPKAAPKAPKGASTKASPAPAKGRATTRSAPARAVTAAEQAPSMFDQNVTLTVAALMTVIGLLLGLIVGFMWGGAMDQPSTGASTSTSTQAPATSGQPAPLTPEQINAGLPAGHVPVTGATTATPTK